MASSDNSFTTEIGPVFLDDPFKVYEEAQYVQRIRNIPRFGHTKDFSVFLDTNNPSPLKDTELSAMFTASIHNVQKVTNLGGSAEFHPATDYAKGMQFVFLIVLLPFVVWSLVLIGLKVHDIYSTSKQPPQQDDNDPPALTPRQQAAAAENQEMEQIEKDEANTTTRTSTHSAASTSSTTPRRRRLSLVGSPLQIPQELDTTNEDYKNDPVYKQWHRSVTIYRGIYLIACITSIVFATLLITNGATMIESTNGMIAHTNHDINDIVDEAVDITHGLTNVGQVGLALKYQLIYDLRSEKRLCPGAPDYVSSTPEGQELLQNAQAVQQLLRDIGDFNQTAVDGFQEGFLEFKAHNEEIMHAVESFEDNKQWVFYIIAAPVITVATIMIFATLSAHLDGVGIYNNFILPVVMDRVLLPVFIVMIGFSYCLCSIIIVLVVANADFCGEVDVGAATTASAATTVARTTTVNTQNNHFMFQNHTMNEPPTIAVPSASDELLMHPPDKYMALLFQQLNYNDTNFVSQAVNYYLHQCTEGAHIDPFLTLRRYAAYMDYASGSVNKLAESLNAFIQLNDNSGMIPLMCNMDYEMLTLKVGRMNSVLIALREESQRALNITSCDRVVPMYTDTLYDGVCRHNVAGLIWIFASLLVLSVMGMIMITLRSAYQNFASSSPVNYNVSQRYISQRYLAGKAAGEPTVAASTTPTIEKKDSIEVEAYEGDEGDDC